MLPDITNRPIEDIMSELKRNNSDITFLETKLSHEREKKSLLLEIINLRQEIKNND